MSEGTFDKKRKFNVKGEPEYICEDFGHGPKKLPGLCAITLKGKWAVDTYNLPEREEYELILAAGDGEDMRVTLSFISSYDRDAAVRLMTSNRSVTDLDKHGALSTIINENSKKILGASALVTAGFWIWKKYSKPAIKEKEFDEAAIYSDKETN